ncbi:MAG TPA: hypothetical protein VGY66_36690 [Gemmataceae bacterium]|jgi:hypothetical protein|nr:hypothetical protein [Gemmataceae bacterium]
MASDNSNRKEASKAKAGTREKEPGLLVPPEERFWKRYSPNHEFPLSSASSALMHLFALGILVLGAHTFAKWETPVDVDAIEIGGGGGRPDGAEGPATGKFAHNEDVKDVVDSTVPVPKVPPRGENLKEVDKLNQKVVETPDQRLIDDETSVENRKRLSALGEQVRDRLNALQRGQASKGLGGTGEGGGEGTGKGPGKGSGVGPGTGRIDKRQERQKRWTMIFNIRDPEDYARQLSALGAYLAVPGSREGEYLVIEDLSRRPVVARLRNISDINRMFWIDDKADAVEPLFRVLGYEKIPSYFVAFFPVELERELLKKELEYKNLPESKIEETKFQIKHTGGSKIEPVVISQEAKP